MKSTSQTTQSPQHESVAPEHPTRDAVAFVREAQRMTNERDLPAIRHVFSDAGHWTCIIDGLRTEDHGLDAIDARWRLLCAVMNDQGLRVDKELVAVDGRTIVNRWSGSTRHGASPSGLEVWVFDDSGLVVDQLLIGSLDPRDEQSRRARLGLFLSRPRTALALLRAEREESAR